MLYLGVFLLAIEREHCKNWFASVLQAASESAGALEPCNYMDPNTHRMYYE